MTAPFKSIEDSADIGGLMREIGARAKAATRVLALAPAAQKNRALAAMADAIRAGADAILAANGEDVAEAKAAGANAAFLDRLALDRKRVAAMAGGVEVVRDLDDPVGSVTERWTRPNALNSETNRSPCALSATPCGDSTKPLRHCAGGILFVPVPCSVLAPMRVTTAPSLSSTVT